MDEVYRCKSGFTGHDIVDLVFTIEKNIHARGPEHYERLMDHIKECSSCTGEWQFYREFKWAFVLPEQLGMRAAPEPGNAGTKSRITPLTLDKGYGDILMGKSGPLTGKFSVGPKGEQGPKSYFGLDIYYNIDDILKSYLPWFKKKEDPDEQRDGDEGQADAPK